MRLINYKTNSPEENIALDELVLLKAENGGFGESFRIWEPKEYFVVLGRACQVEEDCLKDNCDADNVRLIRRISGGGTILQGPGCINFSMVLSYESNEAYKGIRSSYRYILGNISEGFKHNGHKIEFFPVSDLAFQKRKISGNAQARKRSFFLHHGTFLYGFDINKISRYLKYPSREPEYRKRRSHAEFLVNVPVIPDKLIEIIKNPFLKNETKTGI